MRLLLGNVGTEAKLKLHRESRRAVPDWAGQGRADSKIINGDQARRDEARRESKRRARRGKAGTGTVHYMLCSREGAIGRGGEGRVG